MMVSLVSSSGAWSSWLTMSRSLAMRRSLMIGLVVMVVLAPAAHCVNATTRVTVSSTHCFGALGEKGLLVYPLDRHSTYKVIPPPAGLSQIYDIFLEPGGRFLFVLSLKGSSTSSSFAVLSLADPMAPTVVGAPVAVFAGHYGAICGKSGTIVVAGGESNMTVWKYDTSTGEVLSKTPEQSLRVGKSQDRVLLSNDGRVAYVKGELDPYMGHGVGYGVMIVPLDNPAAISPIQVPNPPPAPLGGGRVPPLVFPMESALSEDGNVLFTAHGEGVSAINVSNPLDCLLLTDLETIPQEYYSIAVVGQRGFAVGYTPMPRVLEIDITDPTELVEVKMFRFTFQRPVSIAANRKSFFVGDRETDCVVVIDRTTQLASWTGCDVQSAASNYPNTTTVYGHRGYNNPPGSNHRTQRPPAASSAVSSEMAP